VPTRLAILCLVVLLACNSKKNSALEKEARALNNKAVKLMRDNPDSALILVDKAISIAKDNHIFYMNKAGIYCSKGEYVNAIEAPRQVLKIKPTLA